MLIVSASRSAAKSVVARKRPAVTADRMSFSGTSGMRFAPRHGVDLRAIDVDADRVEARAREFDDEREADVPETDDGRRRGSRFELDQQVACKAVHTKRLL